MGENSKISWCDHTFNPWIGCEKVAAGCTNCYAEELMDTRYKRVEWGKNGTRKRTAVSTWRELRKMDKKALSDLGRKAVVFIGSLCDVCEDRDELIPWREDLCAEIMACENILPLLLTKRPENLTRFFPLEVLERCGVGASVAEQADADRNAPLLCEPELQVAKFRFLSIEPQVGPVEIPGLNWWECTECGAVSSQHPADAQAFEFCGEDTIRKRTSIEWVIGGGESGPNARPYHLKWARLLIQQCEDAGVAYFQKQVGSNFWIEDDVAALMFRRFDDIKLSGDGHGDYRISVRGDPKGQSVNHWPREIRVQEFPVIDGAPIKGAA